MGLFGRKAKSAVAVEDKPKKMTMRESAKFLRENMADILAAEARMYHDEMGISQPDIKIISVFGMRAPFTKRVVWISGTHVGLDVLQKHPKRVDRKLINRSKITSISSEQSKMKWVNLTIHMGSHDVEIDALDESVARLMEMELA